jgi:hypothetical protein
LNIREKVFDEFHPALATIYRTIGHALFSLDQLFSGAEITFSKEYHQR